MPEEPDMLVVVIALASPGRSEWFPARFDGQTWRDEQGEEVRQVRWWDYLPVNYAPLPSTLD